MPYEWSTYVTGTFAVVALVIAAALLGWLAARLLLHATRSSAQAPDRSEQ